MTPARTGRPDEILNHEVRPNQKSTIIDQDLVPTIVIKARKLQHTDKRIVGQINRITGPKKEIGVDAMIDPNMTETIVDKTTVRAGKATVNTMIAEVKSEGKPIEVVMMNTENPLAGMKTTNKAIDEMINRTVRIQNDGRMTCIWSPMLLGRQIQVEVTEKAVLFVAKNV